MLADAREEVGAHSRVEAVRVAAANREEAQLGVRAERRQCHGSDLHVAAAEQVIALRIANLATTRLGVRQESVEHLEVGMLARAQPQEPSLQGLELGER